MNTYTTKQGDTWDSIAFTQMGDCTRMNQLMWRNRKYLDIYLFPAGIVLTIPEPEIAVSSNLPPWKQVAG